MPKALFFDLAGTLSDTRARRTATRTEVMRPHGVEVDAGFHGNEPLDAAEAEFVVGEVPDPAVHDGPDR